MAGVPAVPSAGANTLERLERLEQEVQRLGQGLEHLQQQLLACSHNERARRHNLHIRLAPGRPALQPLRRETAAAAGGAHQLGALPPPGMFPADIVALWELTDGEIDALQEFYGQQFAGGSVERRGKSFEDYICH